MRIDSIYTPSVLAREMVEAAGGCFDEGHLVADFAAGSGELLIAAQERWPLAQIIATDIDRVETQCLKKKNNGWQISRCDFLNPKSRNGSPVMRQLVGRTSLILLNPPFSCRGGTRVAASASGILIKCSVGLAFVVNSIDYLATGGTLVAILPSGSLSSEKDIEAWKLLRRLSTVETIMYNGHRTFPKTRVDTVVVRLTKLREPKEQTNNAENEIALDFCKTGESDIRLVRGNIQMDEIQTTDSLDSIELIHSTELKEGTLINGHHITNKRAKLIRGPAVLIPRVGRPIKEKVVYYPEEGTFALSDCVLALQCPSKRVAQEIWESLIENWNLLEQSYSGSGAKYLTIRKYVTLLRQLGHLVNTAPNIEKKVVVSQS